MLRRTIRLDNDTALVVQRIARTQRRSQADLIREVLSGYARRHPRPLPAGLGKYDSGKTYVSERSREILRQAALRKRWR